MHTYSHGGACMQECHDEIKEDDGAGQQSIFRIVRIPFKVLVSLLLHESCIYL